MSKIYILLNFNRIFKGLKVKILKNVLNNKLKTKLYLLHVRFSYLCLEICSSWSIIMFLEIRAKSKYFGAAFFSKMRFFALKSQNFKKVYKINEKNKTILIGKLLRELLCSEHLHLSFSEFFLYSSELGLIIYICLLYTSPSPRD